MPFLTLQSPLLRLSLAPHLGAGIADLSLKGPGGFFFPLMRRAAPDEENASLLASFFMAPWVNRIRGGRFSFSAQPHALRTNTPDNMAQHGDVRKRPWNLLDLSASSATLEFDSRDHADSNWPWSYLCRAAYTLVAPPTSSASAPPAHMPISAGALRIDLSIRNTDRSPFPAGCGHHPYFSRRLWNDADDLHLRVPVASRYPLESGCAVAPPIPAPTDPLAARLRSSAPIPIDPVDDLFAADPALPRAAELHWPASRVKLRIIPSPNMAHWVVYAPHANPNAPSPLSFIAVEPQTQANDALNLASRSGGGPIALSQTGTQVLAPNEELATSCVFEVEVN